MKKKLYCLESDDEMFFTKEYFESMLEPGQEMELIEGEPFKEQGYFWCRYYDTQGESGECGKICDAYDPINGKSGRCKYHTYTFYRPTDKAITITK